MLEIPVAKVFFTETNVHINILQSKFCFCILNKEYISDSFSILLSRVSNILIIFVCSSKEGIEIGNFKNSSTLIERPSLIPYVTNLSDFMNRLDIKNSFIKAYSSFFDGRKTV